MTQQLFRDEVMQARTARAFGPISLSRPLKSWVLVLAAMLTALGIASYLVLGSYTRRSTVAGVLVPSQGLASVLAPTGGVLGEVHVAEGVQVRAGQVLAVITVPHVAVASGRAAQELEESLGRRQQSLVSLQEGQLRAISAQALGLAAQLEAARAELKHLQSGMATREQQVAISERTLARMRELFPQQYVSRAQLDQQESTLLEQVAALQDLKGQASAADRSVLQLQQALAELPGQRKAVESGVQRDLAALAQERVQRDAAETVVIAAPVQGVVATQVVQQGQAVQQGQPLLTLLPGDGHLEAQLLVPSRAIGFIEPGDAVLLRYQAFPWQKFGHQAGRVSRISRSALTPAELGAVTGAGGPPVYRVTVALARQSVTAYGHEEMLKPGLLLEADILGESRRLAEWLFEPLYSIKGRPGRS
jgi:membrane fusion protein